MKQADQIEFAMDGSGMNIRRVPANANRFTAHIGALGSFADEAEVSARLRDSRNRG